MFNLECIFLVHQMITAVKIKHSNVLLDHVCLKTTTMTKINCNLNLKKNNIKFNNEETNIILLTLTWLRSFGLSTVENITSWIGTWRLSCLHNNSPQPIISPHSICVRLLVLNVCSLKQRKQDAMCRISVKFKGSPGKISIKA